MKNHISFTTGLFDSGIVNSGSKTDELGQDLARWLIARSSGDEFTFAEPMRTGHGWTDTVSADGEEFRLGFGLLQGSAGADYADWRITIEKVNKWKLFGSKDSKLRDRLCDLVHNVLRDEGQIREVHWG
ncbi:MAG: hypothetical protein ABJA02_11500 [Acidobacteriota bacterium]